jgi:hypothetical protein
MVRTEHVPHRVAYLPCLALPRLASPLFAKGDPCIPCMAVTLIFSTAPALLFSYRQAEYRNAATDRDARSWRRVRTAKYVWPTATISPMAAWQGPACWVSCRIRSKGEECSAPPSRSITERRRGLCPDERPVIVYLAYSALPGSPMRPCQSGALTQVLSRPRSPRRCSLPQAFG